MNLISIKQKHRERFERYNDYDRYRRCFVLGMNGCLKAYVDRLLTQSHMLRIIELIKNSLTIGYAICPKKTLTS